MTMDFVTIRLVMVSKNSKCDYPVIRQGSMLAVFLLALWSQGVGAVELYYAGFSFAGDYSQNQIRFPVAADLSTHRNETGVPVLDAALSKVIGEDYSNNAKLVKAMGFPKSGASQLSIAFALSEESTEEVEWGGRTLYIYRVISQILVFDFDDKKLISNFPAMLQYQDIVEKKRSPEDHYEVFKRIYLDTETVSTSIFREWVRRLNSVTIKPSYSAYLKLIDVVLDPELEAQMPNGLQLSDAYASQVAQQFEFILSEQQEVSLIPFTKGQAIGAKMAARFSNGDSFQLALPQPDFAMTLRVHPFKYLHQTANVSDKHAFGAFVTLAVEQPDLGKSYLDMRFKNVNVVVFDKRDETVVDKWQSFQTSLRSLFVKLSTQISVRDKKVLADMNRDKSAKKQLTKFEEVIRKCM
jgi:hypothetical protein